MQNLEKVQLCQYEFYLKLEEEIELIWNVYN